MKKENFKNLLIDLYNIYNPANLKYVDELVEKNSRLEFDSLKNIFIKYNYKSAEHYDPNIGTDEYILNLIREYNSGNRSLQNIDIKQSAIQRKNEEKSKEVNVKPEQINKIEQIFKSQIEELGVVLKEKEEQIQNLINNKGQEPTIRVISNYSNSEINLPNKKYLSNLGTGSRIITRDNENKVIGLEIQDITIDFVSDDKNPLIEITVKKV
jgi:hypothetical protein